MGLQEEAPSKGSNLGDPVWDDDFDFSRVTAQKALADICKLAEKERAKLATRKAMPGGSL